jgi:transcription initiation factor TFIIH subunit 3
VDPRQLQQDLVTGIAEIVARAASKAPLNQDPANRLGGMAAALSNALCLMNRFLVAAHTGRGISALRTEHYLDRIDEEGVIALMGKQTNSKKNKDNLPSSAWSPRVLLIQASDDRSRDYNAFMNCAFAAAKQRIVLDGCFLASGADGAATSSSFLEQAVDLTGGVFFLVPSGAAQVGGALTGVLTTVFLAPPSCRPALHLPALDKVDFRARCFETGETVDKAMVCNRCLSIFKTIAPQQTHCPTCQAPIVR